MSTKLTVGNQSSFSVIENPRDQIRRLVEAQMRDAALALVSGLFHEEVERLCGPPFSRKTDHDLYYRGGWDPGSVIVRGQRVKVKKARVKRHGKDVELGSYKALQGFDLLHDKVMRHMLSGVSTRDYDGLLDHVSGGLGLKKSSVSKAFAQGSRQALDEINGRRLEQDRFAALMIDGIEFQGRTITAAMGITVDGKKLMLGLREGATENSEVCKDLLASFIERGMNRDAPFLLVLDGSKALRKACRQVFGDSFPVQRCIRHKERNILDHLPKEKHPEFRRRWKLIHSATHHSTAKAEYERLLPWLAAINLDAQASALEAELETLTVIQLGAGRELRKSLMSTNPLESAFDGLRSRSTRVKNWKSGKDQLQRWSAAALLEVEKRIRKVRGRDELSSLLQAVRKISLQDQHKAA